MARPRIFVSSTYYDLKHVRSSLDNFIESLGFDSILSEKGDIAYISDVSLDESCYREASNADILVLIVGGRYGSPASTDKSLPAKEFFDRYDSITRKEYETASSREIPTYILIEANVYSEYQTYLRNKGNTNIAYAHVDSINIFILVEHILAQPRNNPIQTFERFSDIERWLREQWAGLFRELLQRTNSQQQLSTLSSQVETLGAISETLRRYLENVMTKISPDDAAELIKSENKRLSDVEIKDGLQNNRFYRGSGLSRSTSVEKFRVALEISKTYKQFVQKVVELSEDLSIEPRLLELNIKGPLSDLNEARKLVGKAPFKIAKEEG